MKLKTIDLYPDTRHPDTRLNRKDLPAALEARGLKISSATLASLASRGGGPAYDLFNGRAVYRWKEALAWAEAALAKPRRSKPRRTTSEVV